MMRAILILVGLGILVAMELATPPRTKTVSTGPPFPPLTAEISESRDTLVKTDRLEIPHAPYQAPTQPISFIERTPPAGSPAVIPEEVAKIVDQHGRGTSVRRAAVVLPKPRPKLRDPKRAAKPDRSKAVMELKSCQANAFKDLLKALNLSDGCET
jgi:hypothetical protein